MYIRAEQAADRADIAAITEAAFAAHAHSIQNEHRIIDALREAGALTLSLVALVDDRIAGHIAFSPIVLSGDAQNWFGVGPLSVVPDRQGCGIGSALVKEGLAHIKQSGAHGCVVMGEPSYYTRFGFRHRADIVYKDVPQEYFMALAFDGRWPRGTVCYHRAFSI